MSVQALQDQASDPKTSALVMANAGSGKTWVLVQRVIRLLLAGNAPSGMLCLTYTKAAAAHMANKIYERLRVWVSMDDEELTRELKEFAKIEASASTLKKARILFGEVLETPGGLRVETIHAFCTRLLQQFPLESGVTPGFMVLEDRARSQMVTDALHQALSDAAQTPESELSQSLGHLVANATDQKLEEIISNAMDAGLWQDLAVLRKALGVGETLTSEKLITEIMKGGSLPRSQWVSAADRLLQSSKTMKAMAVGLMQATHGDFNAYIDVFLTKDSDPRSDTGFPTKDIIEQEPELAAKLRGERDRVKILFDALKAVRIYEKTRSLSIVAKHVKNIYEDAKRKAACLDFADLIDRTRTLLNSEQALWVRYKLDARIDHILIDEAQDTSPQQWEIIRSLTEDFFSGEGNSERKTVFTVGDIKQSIYSFQGAQPKEFSQVGRNFIRSAKAVDRKFEKIELKKSFRSAQRILAAVDRIFMEARAHTGLSGEENLAPLHEALRTEAGEVQIWPLIAAAQKDEIEAWEIPFLEPSAAPSPTIELARRIAASVEYWIRQQRFFPSQIMVLVRQRGSVFNAVIREFQARGIPVSGADRLVLLEDIAIMDLLALGDCLMWPGNEYALVCVLKSPMFGMSEEELFSLCHNRQSTLFETLPEKVSKRLLSWRQMALTRTPFEFYSWLLADRNQEGKTIRQSIYERLGREVEDPIAEFLSLALEFESRQPPVLQNFLIWLRSGNVEIKRDMDTQRSEVRVMTVHGAKGLEADCVILADTTTNPQGRNVRELLKTPDGVVWAGGNRESTGFVNTLRNQEKTDAEEEYRRLLYVALTRARDMLVVCGKDWGANRRPKGCWYDLIHEALALEATLHPAEAFAGDILIWRKADEIIRSRPKKMQKPSRQTPDWFNAPSERKSIRKRNLLPPHHQIKPLQTSNPSQEKGKALHTLLQLWPHIPEDTETRLSEEVKKLTARPDLDWIFSQDSRAEVPLCGVIAGEEITARIDRLVILGDEVRIIDFKTDQNVPIIPEDVPLAYHQQLETYRALASQIWPQHRIRSFLLWTKAGSLMEIMSQQKEMDRASLDVA